MHHIADLGATIVYISPLNVHGYPSVFGPSTPYEIKDYDVIDPEYGTEADLKALVAQAHKLGLKVIMDIVYAHSANDNVLLNRPGFFQRTPDGKLIMSRWKTPMPDFKNPQVHEYFRNNMLHWVRDVGVDGFRADVAGGVPADFWDEARDAMDKVNPNVIMLAEVGRAGTSPQGVRHQLQLPVLLGADRRWWSTANRRNASGSSGRRPGPLSRAALVLLHLNDNHDRNRANVVFGEKAALATSVLNFTLDGIPLLYNGEEVGDTHGPATAVPRGHPLGHLEAGESAPHQHCRTAERQTPRLQADHSDAPGRGGAHVRRPDLGQQQQSGRRGQLHPEEGQRRDSGVDQSDQPHHEDPGGRAGRELRGGP